MARHKIKAVFIIVKTAFISFISLSVLPYQVFSHPYFNTCHKKRIVLTSYYPFWANRQWPAFPSGCPPSIIGAMELNFCVRDGYRWILHAIITGLNFCPKALLSLDRFYAKVSESLLSLKLVVLRLRWIFNSLIGASLIFPSFSWFGKYRLNFCSKVYFRWNLSCCA